MKLDIDGGQAFVLVAEPGGFHKAAQKLDLSQTALTRRIQKLEHHLGLRLLDRTMRCVSLTRIGREFLPRAIRLVDDPTGSLGRRSGPAQTPKPDRRRCRERALDSMGRQPGVAMRSLAADQVRIGSCTEGSIVKLRAAAGIVNGRRARTLAPGTAGSGLWHSKPEREGLDRLFTEASLVRGHPGCSMCVGTDGDTVPAGQCRVWTSNRNVVGPHGTGSSTYLRGPPREAGRRRRRQHAGRCRGLHPAGDREADEGDRGGGRDARRSAAPVRRWPFRPPDVSASARASR